MRIMVSLLMICDSLPIQNIEIVLHDGHNLWYNKLSIRWGFVRMSEEISREQEQRNRKRQKKVRKLMGSFGVALVVSFFLGVVVGRLTALHDVDMAVRDQGYENPQLGKLLAIVHRGEDEPEETETEEAEILPEVGKPQNYTDNQVMSILEANAQTDSRYAAICENRDIYPSRLLLDLVNNPEMVDFVANYPGDSAPEDSLTEKELASKHPLFLQWDPRWGYHEYGDGSNIAVSGCGPTALAMVVVSLTDQEVTPSEVAQYAMDHNYYLKGTGTLWKLMTDGASHYGLNSEKININEEEMKEALDYGGILVLSMKKGDFTNIGHFIVVYGYDENGFKVNDPFCKYRSSIPWEYDVLSKQIKGVWKMTAK